MRDKKATAKLSKSTSWDKNKDVKGTCKLIVKSCVFFGLLMSLIAPHSYLDKDAGHS